jgi:hypothetical protein
MKRLVLTACAVALVVARPVAQQPTLESLMSRATEYVVKYFDVMSNLTAEEHYVQDLVAARPIVSTGSSLPGMPSGPTGVIKKAHDREIRSDVNLVNVGPPIEWRTYRDVYLVDTKPVRDRDDRLAKLILQPAGSARVQAERIATEGARFNISGIGRVLNEPGLPLVFLQKSLQPRFQFTLDKKDGSAWIVKYQEQARPTVFKHNGTLDNPSTGRLWIDPQTGEITKAEMLLAPAELRVTFTTTFKHDNKFGIAVPTQLQEQIYTNVSDGARRLVGTAEYSKYRKFGVTTEESIKD